MALLTFSLLSLVAASPLNTDLHRRQYQQQQPYQPQNGRPAANFQPRPVPQGQSIYRLDPSQNYQPVPAMAQGFNGQQQQQSYPQQSYAQPPRGYPQQQSAYQPRPAVPAQQYRPQPANYQSPGYVTPVQPANSGTFSNNWGSNPLGGLGDMLSTGFTKGLEGLGTGLSGLISGGTASTSSTPSFNGPVAVPPLVYNPQPATPAPQPDVTTPAPAAQSSASSSNWLGNLFGGGSSSSSPTAGGAGSGAGSASSSSSSSSSSTPSLSDWLTGIFSGGKKTTPDAQAVTPAPAADAANTDSQGKADFLDVTTASQDGVLCRRYPDNIISDPRNAMVFVEPTKIRVSCWSSPSISGYYGSHHGDATWLLTTTGCYVNEMTVQDKADYQKRLGYCVPPLHWVGTLDTAVKRVDCYDAPDVNARSSVVGSGPNVDLACSTSGDWLNGTMTWYKHKDNNCYVPNAIFAQDGFLGTAGGKC